MNEKTSARKTAKRVAESAGWLLAVKYYNPATWINGAGNRGKFFQIAFNNVRHLFRIPKPAHYRKETFEQACQRLHLTEQDIQKRKGEFTLVCRVCYAIAAALLLSSTAYATGGYLSTAFCTLLLSVAAGWSGFARAFRVWQIRHRKLMPLSCFLYSPEAWIV